VCAPFRSCRVYAVTPGKTEDDFDTVALIIEVKGSWHREVLTAMESQLLGDYLEHNQRCQHGLYVVGWYASPRWDARDRRRARSAKFPDPASLGVTLYQKARALSVSGGRTIRSLVLNVSLGNAVTQRLPRVVPNSRTSMPRLQRTRKVQRGGG
jgi:hypothetical protein